MAPRRALQSRGALEGLRQVESRMEHGLNTAPPVNAGPKGRNITQASQSPLVRPFQGNLVKSLVKFWVFATTAKCLQTALPIPDKNIAY